jgi:hypothetical protein
MAIPSVVDGHAFLWRDANGVKLFPAGVSKLHLLTKKELRVK